MWDKPKTARNEKDAFYSDDATVHRSYEQDLDDPGTYYSFGIRKVALIIPVPLMA